MPTYGYECLGCANHFEIMQSIKDDPLKICESCGGALRKRIYPVGIAFKGPGFYVNDYSGPSKKSSSEPSDAAPKAETASVPKSESPTVSDSSSTPKTESSGVSDSAPTPKAEPASVP